MRESPGTGGSADAVLGVQPINSGAGVCKPATTLGTATFGLTTSTVSNARIIQFAMRLE